MALASTHLGHCCPHSDLPRLMRGAAWFEAPPAFCHEVLLGRTDGLPTKPCALGVDTAARLLLSELRVCRSRWFQQSGRMLNDVPGPNQHLTRPTLVSKT